MLESGYYPAGAEFDPNAPYNQRPEPEPTTYLVTVRLFTDSGHIDKAVRVQAIASEYHDLPLWIFESRLIEEVAEQVSLRDYDDYEIVDYKEVG